MLAESVDSCSDPATSTGPLVVTKLSHSSDHQMMSDTAMPHVDLHGTGSEVRFDALQHSLANEAPANHRQEMVEIEDWER